LDGAGLRVQPAIAEVRRLVPGAKAEIKPTQVIRTQTFFESR
jgi:hypothetical protein